MSCQFCKTYDFTSVAVKDNNIHLAGGNTNFVDYVIKHPESEIKLFQFCPICGSALLYGASGEDAIVPSPKKGVVRVALDEYGNRIPFAIEDGDIVVPEDVVNLVKQLRTDTGVGLAMCKDAYEYAMSRKGGYDMMIAYIKAKVLAVKTNCPFDARVDGFMKDVS